MHQILTVSYETVLKSDIFSMRKSIFFFFNLSRRNGNMSDFPSRRNGNK